MSEYLVEYEIKTEDGHTLESNIGKEPIRVTPGETEVLPVIAETITSMNAGDEKTVTVGSDDAFGPVNPELIIDVHLSNIDEEARRVGMLLEFEDESGEKFHGMIEKIETETAKVNFNHPMAGKPMVVTIKVLEIN